MTPTQIREELFRLQDSTYQAFQCKLMPTVSPDTVIGVRVPALRSLAKDLHRTGQTAPFLAALPHDYYEENNLHAFLLEQIPDFSRCVEEVERFLPYVDNWATCDGLRPNCFGRQLHRLLPYITKWLASSHVYTVRFGLSMLMLHFLDEHFAPSFLDMAAGVKSEEYYVNMMLSWYFATALAKQWEAMLPYLTEHRLPLWVHNKTIQKAVESRRITPVQKELLRVLRRKEG